MSLPRPLMLGMIVLATALVALVSFLVVMGRAQRVAPAATTAQPAGETTTGATPTAPARPLSAPVAGVPTPVLAALGERKLVVLLFSQAEGADDAATRTAVQALERSPDAGLAVFQADVGELPRYRPLLGDVGITQVPAVVLLDSRRRARLLEGYLDEGSLRQHVVDLRR